MIIKSVQVKNFRSIKNEILYCDKLTALVGANGSGKSSFLHVMELFSSRQPKIDQEDFYNKDISKEVSISITFGDLSDVAKNKFEKYVQNNELTIDRIFTFNENKITSKFHGSTLQNVDFIDIRKEIRASDAKQKYDILRIKNEYENFPNWQNFEKTKEYLSSWELSNPTFCMRIHDDGQFFGFTEVGQGYLGEFIRFLYIPAVRDALDDATERKGSALYELMNLVIRNVLSQRTDIKQLQDQMKQIYDNMTDPSRTTELNDLADEMTKTLQKFVPDAAIELTWQSSNNFQLPLPDAIAHLVEDGYKSPVNHTGHGLQRAFIMTMLQHLSLAQNTSGQNTSKSQQKQLPTLVLIIEEPELYQHPNRQRHLSDVFLALTKGVISGVAGTTQILYSTHSPHFVGIDRIDQIRLLRKITDQNGSPKITKIFSTNLETVAENLSKLPGSQKYTADSLLARLQVIMTPLVNEGFFADVVILVEGEVDRSAILAAGEIAGYKLESKGYSIIPCLGKGNLDKPAIIFKNLKLPTYIIWDGDKSKGDAPTSNHKILELAGEQKTDWPEYVNDTSACFGEDIETTIKNEIGDTLFAQCFSSCCTEHDLKSKDADKNPLVFYEIIKKAKIEGVTSSSLERIIEKILKLRIN